MSQTNNDEMVNNFVAIANCSNDEAKRYLEAANWDPQAAMEIFFDVGAGESEPSSNAREMNPRSGTRGF